MVTKQAPPKLYSIVFLLAVVLLAALLWAYVASGTLPLVDSIDLLGGKGKSVKTLPA